MHESMPSSRYHRTQNCEILHCSLPLSDTRYYEIRYRHNDQDLSARVGGPDPLLFNEVLEGLVAFFSNFGVLYEYKKFHERRNPVFRRHGAWVSLGAYLADYPNVPETSLL